MIRKNFNSTIKSSKKTIKYEFKKFNFIDKKEISSVTKVLKSGNLSGFYANKKNFSGGNKVLLFEKNLKDYFGVKYAITFNSWTSGLIACVGAINIKPGDEVILPAWTMSACAMSILHWGGIPVFSDIDENFNLDPKKIEEKISNKTKAIMMVDIFGHPANFNSIKKIADKYNIKIIDDAAQSIGSKYHGKYTGTYSDLGGFSFNAHKHIQTGEGGVVLTNNKNYCKKLKLIRNHGEMIIDSNSRKEELYNNIGYNFRPTEIEAAIGIEQLKKLKKIVNSRVKIARALITGLKHLPFLKLPKVSSQCTHSFYVFGMIIDTKNLNISSKKILAALIKEGVQGLSLGYVNLNELPIFKKKIAYGVKNFPWSLNKKFKKYNYKDNPLPLTEKLHNSDLIKLGLCRYDYSKKDVKLIIKAFNKVWNNLIIPSSKFNFIKLKKIGVKNLSSDWIDWLNDKDITKYSRQNKKKHSYATQYEYIQKAVDNKNVYLYGIFIKNKHVGNIELDKIDFKKKKCNLKFLLGEKKLWNKGLMSIAIKKVLNVAFNKLNLKLICGGCHKDNISSIRVFEKNNFIKIKSSDSDIIRFELKK